MTEIFSTIATDIATTKKLKALSDRARDAEFKNPVADARLKDKTRDWADGELGRPKSRASKAPVEMHETIAALLRAWRHETPYSKDSDFVFPSFKLHGKQPRLGSMIVQDYIRPAAVATGVIAEVCPRFGFYNPGARALHIPDRERTRPGGCAALASPVACGYDDALRSQQLQSEERPSPIHRVFPAER